MAILLESPWPILCFGIVAELALAVALLCTRRGALLWAMLGAAAFVSLGVLVEWLVVTDREAVSDALYDCAAAAEANDAPRLLKYVSPTAAQLRADVRAVFDRFEVRMARISELDISFIRTIDPPKAKAKFKVIAAGRDRQGEAPYQTLADKLVVTFRLEAGRWLIVDCRPENWDMQRAAGGRRSPGYSPHLVQ